MSGGIPGTGCACKVGRDARKYGLDDLDADLERRYVEGDSSLRDLADLVNARIVGAAVEATDADVVGDPGAIYDAIQGDAVPAERRTDVRDQLAYAGVDLGTLTDDFVSHQTVRDHLRSCLDVDTSRTGIESLEEAGDVVEWARARDEQIIDRTIERVRRLGLLRTGPLEVSHTVRVTCVDCGSTYRPAELLERGACECRDGPDPE